MRRKQLNLNSYACKLLIETKSELASKVLYGKFKKRKKIVPFETLKPQKIKLQLVDKNWYILDYTRKEIDTMCPEWIIKMIMSERNREGRTKG